MPSTPAYETPVQPTFEMPSTPTYETPVQPAFEMPSTSTYETPVQPTFEMPSTPTYETPVQPTYEMPNFKSFDFGATNAFTETSVQSNNEQSTLELQDEINRLNNELAKYKAIVENIKNIVEK